MLKTTSLTHLLGKKWTEVCQAAQKATEELNREMAQQYVVFSRDANADKFSLKVGDTDNVVHLDRPNHTIQRSRGKTYHLAIVGETAVWKYDPVDYTSEQIARDEVQQSFEGQD